MGLQPRLRSYSYYLKGKKQFRPILYLLTHKVKRYKCYENSIPTF